VVWLTLTVDGVALVLRPSVVEGEKLHGSVSLL
jgi:hypothetical protein